MGGVVNVIDEETQGLCLLKEIIYAEGFGEDRVEVVLDLFCPTHLSEDFATVGHLQHADGIRLGSEILVQEIMTSH